MNDGTEAYNMNSIRVVESLLKEANKGFVSKSSKGYVLKTNARKPLFPPGYKTEIEIMDEHIERSRLTVLIYFLKHCFVHIKAACNRERNFMAMTKIAT